MRLTDLEEIVATQNLWSQTYRTRAKKFRQENNYRGDDRSNRIIDLFRQSTSALIAIYQLLIREEQDLVVDVKLQPELFKLPQEGVPPS